VKIPSGCTLVGGHAFQYCDLTEVAIPGGCEIGEYAFYECRRLITVTIDSGCTAIRSSTFMRCSTLASVALPSTLKSIGQMAFRGCSALATLAVPKGCQVSEDAFLRSPTSVTRV
jgi:hypothetical protein